MIDKKIIEDRISNFWWYWNIESKIWFIWMEEWFSWDILDLEKRFKKTIWKTVIDIKEDMLDVEDHIKWFISNSPLQRTLSKLILILLVLDWKENINNELIKEYQRNNFGRNGGNHCSLEFMPLPCKSINKKDWIYWDFGIDYLFTRKDYLNYIIPSRIELFKNLINNWNPKIIIFYSFTYLEKYQEIIWEKLIKEWNLYYTKINNILYFVIPHPTAHWYTNIDWLYISNNIKNKLLKK